MKKVYVLISIFMCSLFLFTGCQKTYTITFDANGGVCEIDKVDCKKKETIQVPNKPTREGYNFLYWEKNGSQFNFDEAITSSFTLVAKWEIQKYNVIFDTDGGTYIEDQKVEYGKTIKVSNPTKEGYKFINFYYDEGFNNAMLIFSKINNDIDLYAKFSKIYNITYYLNGGTTKEELLTSYVVEDVENRNIDLILPEKKGYFFRGWHEKEDCSDSNFYRITKNEARDITLFAKWDEAILQNAYLGILGDSISTYKGYIPGGFVHFPYYASSDDGGRVTLEQTWWRITQQTLGCRLGVNNSYSGTCVMNEYGYTTSAENISRLQHSTRFDNLPPDIMIIYMGNNDALVQNLNTANFEKSYRNMLNNIYTLYPNIQLFLGTLSYEKYFVGKDYYQEHLLVTAEVNRIIKSLAHEYNLPIIDFATAYSDSSYLFDTIHPNVLGMSALANVAIDSISTFYNKTTF